MQSVRNKLQQMATQYPTEMIAGQLRDIQRMAFNIGLVLNTVKPKPPEELEICDIGGGVGLFSTGCAAVGFKRVVLVDDFDDPVNHRIGNGVLDLHKRLGIQIEARDAVAKGISDLPGQFDVITSFDSMEHWHRSPKRLFHDVAQKLRPGGLFLLGVPNCVNLRKRLTVPFGRGKWSSMAEWYESGLFRGHVREPDVADLRYIAADMGLTDQRIVGRNWIGYHSSRKIIRLATYIADFPLRLRPSLCADIYLLARSVSMPEQK